MSDTTVVPVPVVEEEKSIKKEEESEENKKVNEPKSNKRGRDEEESEENKKVKTETGSVAVTSTVPTVPFVNNNSSADVVEDEEEEVSLSHWISWEWLTVEVMKECCTFSEPKPIKGKCVVVWINFNFDKFKKMCPTHPGVLPRRKSLYINMPALKASFGYSPHMTANGIQNNLRLLFGDFVNIKSAEFYERMKEWDNWLIDTIYEHRDVWPLKIKLGPGEELTRADVAKKYRAICRDPQDENGNIIKDGTQYMSQKFNTQKEDKKKNPPQKADPYTAFVRVWNNQKQLVKEVLTVDNAVPTKEENEEDPTLFKRREIIIGRNYYCDTIAHLQKLYFAADIGPTLNTDEIMFESEEALTTAQNSKKVCPF